MYQLRIEGMTQRANIYEELKEDFYHLCMVFGTYKNYVRRI
jgi:hypothetical protein